MAAAGSRPVGDDGRQGSREGGQARRRGGLLDQAEDSPQCTWERGLFACFRAPYVGLSIISQVHCHSFYERKVFKLLKLAHSPFHASSFFTPSCRTLTLAPLTPPTSLLSSLPLPRPRSGVFGICLRIGTFLSRAEGKEDWRFGNSKERGGRGRGREGEEERKETSTGSAQKNEAGGGSEAGRGN